MLPYRSRTRALLLAAALFVTGRDLFAQLPPALDDALKRIFEAEEYKVKGLGTVHWLDGGRTCAVLEDSPSQKDLKDVVAYDMATGRREVLVPASRLSASGASAATPIEAFAALDRDRLLLFTNSKKVWRRNTRGDYWYLDRRRGAPRKLGGGGPASSLMFAKISPDGTRVAWVRDNDLSVEDLSSGEIFPPDARRLGDDDQRHLRLGRRGGARHPRRLPLEPGRQAHRVLAVRHDRRRDLHARRRHGRALSDRHPVPLSQGRHAQLGGPHRRRGPLDPRRRVDAASGRSARELRRAHGLGRRRNARARAAESAPEPQRADSRRRPHGRRAPRLSRRVENVGGRRRRGTLARRQPGVPLGEREGRLAPRLSRGEERERRTSCHAVRRRCHPGGGRRREGRPALLPRLARQRDRPLSLPRAARRVGAGRTRHAGRRLRSPCLRSLAGRPLRDPHGVDVRQAAHDRARLAAGPQARANARRRRGARGEGRAAAREQERVLPAPDRRRRRARRLADQAGRLRRVAQVPADRLRVWRARRTDGARSVGRRPRSLPSCARGAGLSRRELRQPRHAGAAGRRLAQDRVRRRRRPLVEGSGRRRQSHRRGKAVRRRRPASRSGAGAAAAPPL